MRGDGSAHVHEDAGEAHSHGPGTGSTSSHTLAGVAAIDLLGVPGRTRRRLLFGSGALLGEAFHTLFDVLASVLAFVGAFVATVEPCPGEDRGRHLDAHDHRR